MLSRRSYLNRKKELERRRRGLARSPFRTTEPRPGSLRDLRRQAKRLVARAAKMRDGHLCRQCVKDGVAKSDIIDAGHLFPRSVFKGTEFDVEAVFGQCRFHNTLHISRPEYMVLWFKGEFGQERYDELHHRATGPTPTMERLAEIIAELTAYVAQLEADRAVAA
jgi:hypothetical protein